MYKAKFIGENNNNFYFQPTNNVIYDIEGLSNLSVSLGTAQGFGQVGDTVQTASISGRNITIKGHIYNNFNDTKTAIRKAFPPFQRGKLIFEDEYYIYCYVKNTPEFSPVNNNGKFMLQLYAPYPMFRKLNKSIFYIGAVQPMFRFPVNYSEPHYFGVKSPAKYVNVYNDSDISIPYRVDFATTTTSENLKLTNIKTFEHLKLNGTISKGDKVSIYQDSDNQLRAELIKNGEITDIISWIDEKSTLYELAIGDNLILASDDNEGRTLSAIISFDTAVGAVYET